MRVRIWHAKYAARLSQKDLKILVGLLTGHNSLNRHLSLLKIAEECVEKNMILVYSFLEDAVLSLCYL